jgi:hypothetical protein
MYAGKLVWTDVYVVFTFHIPPSRQELAKQAYIDFNFHLS